MAKKILITDDSATARALFKACLPNSGKYEVFEADNPTDALAIAIVEHPFLIVLDYNMPDKTGAELARMMKDKGIEAHYVLMSANTQSSVIDEVKALNFIDVIEKPVSAEALQLLLEKIS